MKCVKLSIRLLVVVCALSFNQRSFGMGVTSQGVGSAVVSFGVNLLCDKVAARCYDSMYPSVGIAPETVVKGWGGDLSIEEICTNDQIIGCNDKQGTFDNIVIGKQKKVVSQLIQITIEDELVRVAPGQVFCCRGAGWIQARNLKPGDKLACFEGFVVIDDVKTIDVQTDVWTLAINDVSGVFFISKYGLVTYNFTPQKIWESAKWVGEKIVLPIVVGVIVIVIVSKLPKASLTTV